MKVCFSPQHSTSNKVQYPHLFCCILNLTSTSAVSNKYFVHHKGVKDCCPTLGNFLLAVESQVRAKLTRIHSCCNFLIGTQIQQRSDGSDKQRFDAYIRFAVNCKLD